MSFSDNVKNHYFQSISMKIHFHHILETDTEQVNFKIRSVALVKSRGAPGSHNKRSTSDLQISFRALVTLRASESATDKRSASVNQLRRRKANDLSDWSLVRAFRVRAHLTQAKARPLSDVCWLWVTTLRINVMLLSEFTSADQCVWAKFTHKSLSLFKKFEEKIHIRLRTKIRLRFDKLHMWF